MSEGILVRELLDRTYSLLCKKYNSSEIVLPERVQAEIANDSDYHRTRVGYMGYDKMNLVQANSASWAIGRGEACGQYPAEPYDSDILALEIKLATPEGRKTDEQIKKELLGRIGESTYFVNSPAVGMADGVLMATKNGRFSKKMIEILKPKISEFIAQGARYNQEVILLSTLRAPCESPMLYKPEFAEFLAGAIERVVLLGK